MSNHRFNVGGLWDELGNLQFDFLVNEGLKPDHYLLDIACGCLRGGVHFIPYLEERHYLEIDKNEDLIRAGVEQELGMELFEEKNPQLIISNAFEFDMFNIRPDFALAQSLFTHLPSTNILDCFRKLRQVIQDDGVFYATFFESEMVVPNPLAPHDHHPFKYTRWEMEEFGNESGWTSEYIGDWSHPRGQVIVRYRPQLEEK